MKIIFYLLLLLPFTIFSQELSMTKIDENFSLLLPVDHEVEEFPSATSYSAMLENGHIMITKIPMGDIVNIDDKDKLLQYYDGMKKSFIDESQGTLMEYSLVTIDSIIGSKIQIIQINTDVINRKQFNQYTFVLEGQSYSIVFVYPEKLVNEDPWEKKIMSSLHFPAGLNLNNQFSYSDDHAAAAKLGSLTATIVWFGFLGAIALLIILFVRHRIASGR